MKLKHQFETKHVIVAGCAAIAMVMGAMSVGASISTPNDRTATRAEVSSIVDSKPPTTNQSSTVTGTGMSRQHTLEVRNFLQQQNTPLYTSPAPTKTIRNLSPIFGTANPVQFMDQMVQLQQQQQTQTSNTGTATPIQGTTSGNPTTGSETKDTTTTPTEETKPAEESTKPADTRTPTEDSSSSTQSLLSADSTPAQ